MRSIASLEPFQPNAVRRKRVRNAQGCMKDLVVKSGRHACCQASSRALAVSACPSAASRSSKPAGFGCRAQRGAQGGEGRSDQCWVLLELLQQEGVRALDLDAEGGELADTEVADVLGDEADDVRVGVEVTGQDGPGAGGDVGVLG